MKSLIITSILLISIALTNKVKAQEIWIYTGIGGGFELQKDFGDAGGGISLPIISVGYIKRPGPNFAWVIAPTFEVYKNTLYLSPDGTKGPIWKNVNFEMPVMARIQFFGIKSMTWQSGVYVGFNLKSTYLDAGSEQKVETRTPYFGIPIWINMTFGKFEFGTRVNYQFGDFSPKEFPPGSTGLSDFYDRKTTRIGIQFILGFRLK